MSPLCCLITLTVAAYPSAEPEAQVPPREVVFLAEDRPVFIRFRIRFGETPLEQGWSESVRVVFTCLDRDGDGKLTTKEADPILIGALVRLGTSEANPLPAGFELDRSPVDGNVSIDELTEAVRPILGSFRTKIDRVAAGRTDALFDHLDRDKDGRLTRGELIGIAGSLRHLDLDDNEMISPDELEPFNLQALAAQTDSNSSRRTRSTGMPPAVERVAGESSLRLSRLLIKKYDKGPAEGSGRPDDKLSSNEFAIAEDDFSASDANQDGLLTPDELRKFLDTVPVDIVLDVVFPREDSAEPSVKVGSDNPALKGIEIFKLKGGDIEIAIKGIRIDIHLDSGSKSDQEAKRLFELRFRNADRNKNGYLEEKELESITGQASPLAGMTSLIDRDNDSKIYPNELTTFIDSQLKAARGRVTLTTSDQGRAIFGILDRDRDLRLGTRELTRAQDRVFSWDRDRDGQVAAAEIPYHLQVTIQRGGLAGLTSNRQVGDARGVEASNAPLPRISVGPEWFRLMDRNRDGDVSGGEFLGPREVFDKIDRDKDGLIDPEEAEQFKVPDG